MLRRELKANSLGLASLSHTIARQRARTRFLREGDACTHFFHLQACHRRRMNTLPHLTMGGQLFTEEEAKSEIVYEYYNNILGTPFQRQHSIQLS